MCPNLIIRVFQNPQDFNEVFVEGTIEGAITIRFVLRGKEATLTVFERSTGPKGLGKHCLCSVVQHNAFDHIQKIRLIAWGIPQNPTKTPEDLKQYYINTYGFQQNSRNIDKDAIIVDKQTFIHYCFGGVKTKTI
jgi:hypothetical protein